jgi:hypothetical protein
MRLVAFADRRFEEACKLLELGPGIARDSHRGIKPAAGGMVERT